MMKNNMHSTQGRQLKGTNTGKCSHQHRLLGTPQQIPPLTILLQRLPRSPAPRVRFDYHTRSTLRCLPASYTSSRQCVWEGRGEGRRGDGGALKPIIFRVRASEVPSNRKKMVSSRMEEAGGAPCDQRGRPTFTCSTSQVSFAEECRRRRSVLLHVTVNSHYLMTQGVRSLHILRLSYFLLHENVLKPTKRNYCCQTCLAYTHCVIEDTLKPLNNKQKWLGM